MPNKPKGRLAGLTVTIGRPQIIKSEDPVDFAVPGLAIKVKPKKRPGKVTRRLRELRASGMKQKDAVRQAAQEGILSPRLAKMMLRGQ